MDEQIAKWIIEFLVRQRIDDSILERLISTLPFPHDDSQLEKALLLRRIKTEVSNGTVSETILDLLERVGELDFGEGKVALESMKAAYCAVAVDCTVKSLELEDYEKYGETLKQIWRARVQKMENSENSGLISEKLLSWRDDLEAASSNEEVRDRILSRNTRNEALKAVRGYLAEYRKEMGPSFLEKIAEYVDKMAKSGQGVNEPGEEQVCEGLRNVIEDHDGTIPSEMMANSGQGVNEPGEEQVCEGLGHVVEDHGGTIPSDMMANSGQGVNEPGEEQVCEGLRNVIEDHDGTIPSDMMANSGQGVNEPGEEQVCEGLGNVVEDHGGTIPSDMMANSGQGVNEPGEEQVCEGLGNVIEDHDGTIPSDMMANSGQGVNGPVDEQAHEDVTEAHNGEITNDKMRKSGQRVNMPVEEQTFEHVIEAHNGEIPIDKPSVETEHKQCLSRRKHVGVRKGLVREAFYRKCSKARITNVEEEDKDTSMNKYDCISTPEVENTKAALRSSFVGLSAAVQDPLPEALRYAEQVSSDVQRDAGSGGNHGDEMNVGSVEKTDCLEANRVENNRGDGQQEREECGSETLSLSSDPLEFSEESSPNTRPHLPSPKRRKMVPLKIYQMPKLEKRRPPKKWTNLEEDTLRNGVQKFGRGNWKVILNAFRDIFEERTEVDLKDKWRNMTRYSK